MSARRRMVSLSTFSIVGADLNAGEFGVAVQSKFIAVGAVVPYARSGAGAVATQAYANTDFGLNGISMLAEGLSAAETVRRLV
ncbi:MAG: DUF1028 domain-containing protein, partial [Thermoprotei archaeon]